MAVARAPRLVIAPDIGRLQGRARDPGALQQAQRVLHNPALGLVVMGLAAGVAEWEVAEGEARHAALLHDVAGAAHEHGGNAVRFQVPRDQTHGLVANRSNRHKERDVDLVLPHQLQNLRRIAFAGQALTAQGGRRVEA